MITRSKSLAGDWIYFLDFGFTGLLTTDSLFNHVSKPSKLLYHGHHSIIITQLYLYRKYNQSIQYIDSVFDYITSRKRFPKGLLKVWKSVKMLNFSFLIWHFLTIFVQLKLTCLVTLFDRKLSTYGSHFKRKIGGIFHFLEISLFLP